jgi:hypothetical protein
MRKWGLVVGGALLLASTTAQARNLCDLLKDKGVLNDVEYNECMAALEKEEAKTEKKAQEVVASRWPKWLDMLTPFGDFRLRQEGFYEEGMVANNRFRLRARIGLLVNPSSEVQVGFRLASGNANDPISTNQTFDREFTRKPFNLDWAYLTLAPMQSLGWERVWFTVTGGKFPTPVFRTSELVWDDDLSPEGFAQALNLVDSREGFLRGLKLNVLQWTVDQFRAGADPWMLGGQGVLDAYLGSAVRWTGAVADYYYLNINGVARNAINPSSSNFNSSLANSNDVVPTPFGPVTAYKYGFNILNANSELDFANPVGLGIPAGVYFDFAYNTQAATRNLGVYLGFGFGNAGRDWYHDSLRTQGDWGVSYTWIYVEKDAVLSIFSYSDFQYLQQTTPGNLQGSTNVTGSTLRFDYALFSFLQLTAKAHFINALDRAINNAPLVGNPTLVRTQFDAAVKF